MAKTTIEEILEKYQPRIDNNEDLPTVMGVPLLELTKNELLLTILFIGEEYGRKLSYYYERDRQQAEVLLKMADYMLKQK